jgi:hypothetical protein
MEQNPAAKTNPALVPIIEQFSKGNVNDVQIGIQQLNQAIKNGTIKPEELPPVLLNRLLREPESGNYIFAGNENGAQALKNDLDMANGKVQVPMGGSYIPDLPGQTAQFTPEVYSPNSQITPGQQLGSVAAVPPVPSAQAQPAAPTHPLQNAKSLPEAYAMAQQRWQSFLQDPSQGAPDELTMLFVDTGWNTTNSEYLKVIKQAQLPTYEQALSKIKMTTGADGNKYAMMSKDDLTSLINLSELNGRADGILGVAGGVEAKKTGAAQADPNLANPNYQPNIQVPAPPPVQPVQPAQAQVDTSVVPQITKPPGMSLADFKKLTGG